MARKKSQDSAVQAPAFPYEKTWEEIGSGWVTLASIAAKAEEYERYEAFVEHLELDVPRLDREKFEALVAPLDLPPDSASQLAEHMWLITGFWLTHQRRTMFHADLETQRERIAAIALHARTLYDLNFRITGPVQALMQAVRLAEPGVIDRKGPTPRELGRTLHDLSLIAERITKDLAPRKTGRHSQHLRDTMIRLAIEAVEASGLEDLVISRGTKDNPHPHLKGRAGQFLRAFFTLVAPEMSEPFLAPIIERVRRKGQFACQRGKAAEGLRADT